MSAGFRLVIVLLRSDVWQLGGGHVSDGCSGRESDGLLLYILSWWTATVTCLKDCNCYVRSLTLSSGGSCQTYRNMIPIFFSRLRILSYIFCVCVGVIFCRINEYVLEYE